MYILGEEVVCGSLLVSIRNFFRKISISIIGEGVSSPSIVPLLSLLGEREKEDCYVSSVSDSLVTPHCRSSDVHWLWIQLFTKPDHWRQAPA